MIAKTIRYCTRCALDSTVPEIQFEENGICNYCKIHDVVESQHPPNEVGMKKLEGLIEKVKAEGKNHRYDCILGVSGGADSTYLLYMAVKWGLRPLAVHFDNGWNSEIAVNNIKNLTNKLGVDLYTVVVDWEEFKDLQIAFLKASTPDAEMPTDVAIPAILYEVASQEGVKYILYGHNYRTEGKIPIVWGYGDGRYINSVYRMFGKKKKLKHYHNLTLTDLIKFSFIKGIKVIRPLYYLKYDKEEAKRIIETELGWRAYGDKHYECIYTRFHHAYLTYRKFGIDQRKIYLSALVRTNQMSREDALKQLSMPPITEQQAQEDVEYVIKKLGLTRQEFDEIWALPPKTFHDYPTYYPLISALKNVIRPIYRLVTPETPAFFYAMEMNANPYKDKLRICFVSQLDVFTEKFATFFKNRGHEVHVITFIREDIDSIRIAKEQGNWEGVHIHDLGGKHPFFNKWFMPLAIFNISRTLRKIKPDIVHTHYIFPRGLYVVMSGYRPHIAGAWGCDILTVPYMNPLFKLMIKYTLSHSEKVSSVSDTLTKGCIDLGVPKEKIIQIPIGVDISVFHPDLDVTRVRAELGWKSNPIIISTRNFEAIYNIQLLINAIPLVLKEKKDARFILAGAGPTREESAALVKKLKIEEYVRFTGFIPNSKLSEYLNASQIYVSTSRSDSLGVSNLEAMACGTFPILTNIPAAREWVTDGFNGFLTSTNDPEALAKHIIAALNDDALRAKASAENQRIIKKRAEQNTLFEKLEREFLVLVNKKRKR